MSNFGGEFCINLVHKPPQVGTLPLQMHCYRLVYDLNFTHVSGEANVYSIIINEMFIVNASMPIIHFRYQVVSRTKLR